MDHTNFMKGRVMNTSGKQTNMLRASRFLSSDCEGATAVREIAVLPRRQEKIILGDFASLDAVRGFCIESNPEHSDALSTHITSLQTKNKVKLILHVANYSDNTLQAKIHQL